MKKLLIALFVVVVIAGIFVISCPDKPLHVSVLKQELLDNATETPKNGWEAVGNVLVSSIAETMIENSLSIENYFLFSLGKYEGKTVSIGLLGHVFTGDIDNLLSKKKEDTKIMKEDPLPQDKEMQGPKGAEFYYSDGSLINRTGYNSTNNAQLFIWAIQREMGAEAPNRANYSSTAEYDSDLARWNEDPIYGWLEKNTRESGTKYSLNPISGDLRIYTTLNPIMQKYAEEAVMEQLVDIQTAFDKERADRNNKPFSPGVDASIINAEMIQARRFSDRSQEMRQMGCSQEEIDASFNHPVNMKIYSWKKKAEIDTVMTPNDSILYYKSLAHAALIAMNPNTGAIQAYVGNEYELPFDYATQEHRQIGSAIQPFIYSLAIEQGMAPCTTVTNERQTFPVGNDTWSPYSNDPEFVLGSKVTLKWGLTHSSTNVSAYLVKKATAEVELDYIRKFHLPFLYAIPTIAVGVEDTKPINLTAAYNVFANKGRYVQPIYISMITDMDGNVLYENKKISEPIITEENAYYLTNMLQATVDEGTGLPIRTKYNMEGDIAGKTGDCYDLANSWFIGFVPKLTVGVWTGWESLNIHFSSEETGQASVTSLPIWATFLKKCQEDGRLMISKSDLFTIPNSISEINCTGGEEDIIIE